MLKACVKYVNNNCITQCKTGAYSFTVLLKTLYISVIDWLKALVINQVSAPFSSYLSTLKNAQTYLMNNSFTHYPQHLLLRLLNEI